jgi:hypothetical protein
MIPCLLPPGCIVIEKAPFLGRRSGSESDEAYVLGVLSSLIFDWYARRMVELAMAFEVLAPMPLPRPPQTIWARQRIVVIAGRLAARDERFADWARAVGVPTGSVKTPVEKAELEAELDALVASLYDLSRDQVEHLFATFHRGWDYKPRLSKVLGYFDAIEAAK